MKKENYLILLRKKIVCIDKKIISLLYKRRKLSICVVKEKIKNKIPIRDLQREQELVNYLIKKAKSKKIDKKYIIKLFQIIIKDSVNIQKKFKKRNFIPKISFLGPKGSYSHFATTIYAKKNFNQYVEVSCKNFIDAVKKVEENKSDYVILPLENTSSGFINEIYSILKKTHLSIISEVFVPINHCLITYNETNLKKINVIYSHSQPFKQCSDFLNKFPIWKKKYTSSTASAMKIISTLKNSKIATLGSEFGAKIYKLKIIKKNLSNIPNNTTRFIIFAKNSITVPKKIPAKITLIICAQKFSKIIVNIKKIFLKYNLTLIKFESISNQKSKMNFFFIDLKNNLSSELLQKGLNEIKKIVYYLKILGCYPIKN